MPRALPTAGAAREENVGGAARSLSREKTSGQSVVTHCRQSCRVWSGTTMSWSPSGWDGYPGGILWRCHGVMQTLRHTGGELFRKGSDKEISLLQLEGFQLCHDG